LKIAFVIYDLSNGGAERVVSLLSRELSKYNKVKIILFCNNIEYEYSGEIIDLNIPSVNSRFGKILNIFKRVKKLKNIFDREKFDKIFSFMESANFITSLTGYNAVLSIRTNPNRFSSITIKLIQCLYNKKNIMKVVTVSKEIEKIVNNFSIKNTKTIYNPLDFRKIEYLQNEDINITYKYIVVVGRLNKVKNFNFLIKAYSNTKIKDKIKLVILGDGSEKDNLQKLILDLNLQRQVIIYGTVNNVYKFLSKAEIFILSSKFEGFPNALIEALACQIPCIATDCPTGPKEIIINEVNGLLVENENEKEMTKAIDRLYFDEELKNKLKNNAKKSIEYLKVELIAKEWLAV